ncbi:MAG: hypothetical protein ACK4SX_11115 [Alcanivoracaceae bacterium]
MRTITKMIGLTALAVAMQGCGDSVGPDLQPAPAPGNAVAVFNPALGGDGLPFPVDLLFASTADGSINIPGKPSSFNPANAAGTLMTSTAVPAAPFLADPQTALNNMDGFSTTAPMVVRFSASIAGPANRTDLQNGVRIFRTSGFDPGAAAPVTISGELIWGVDFVAGVSGGTSLLIQPLRPLQPSTTYIVVIENDVIGASGAAVGQDQTYQLLNGSFQLAVGVPLAQPDFIIQSSDDASCNFSNPASVAVCTKINPVYAAVGAPAAAIAGALAGLEAQALAALDDGDSLSDAYGSLWQLEQLRQLTARHLTALAGQGISPANVSLSYSVSTQNIGGAMAQAKAIVDAAGTEPSFTILNPVSAWAGTPGIAVTSPGPDGDLSTPDYLAHIYLGTLNDVIQFMDPDSQNTSVWKASRASWISAGPCTMLPANTGPAGTENLVACNGFEPAAVKTDHSIPVIISAPRAESLAGAMGFEDCSGGNLPVVIYQHGITSNRGTLLAVADALANACMVGVGIDMPKHGIAPSGNTFSALAQLQAALSGGAFERLVKVSSPMTQCQAMSGVDVGNGTDFYCPSGDNFINLTNLANARDALRQASVDLHSLHRALVEDGGNALNAGNIGTTIDPDRISFVGVSLGGIVGTSFVAQQDDVTAAVLNVAGGGIAKILDGSAAFEPQITAGLFSGAGLIKPSGSYEGFLIIAQTMIDSLDPINFATQIVTNGTPIMMQSVMGNPADNFNCILNGTTCPDQVVPNNVFGASFGPAWGLIGQTGQTSFLANQNFITTPVALAGTDPLAQGTGFLAVASAVQQGLTAAFGIGPVAVDAGTLPATAITFKGLNLRTVTSCGATGGGIVRYVDGTHGSLLTPAGPAGPAQYVGVLQTMQAQMATFVASDGAVIPADSNGVVFTPAVANASNAPCAP